MKRIILLLFLAASLLLLCGCGEVPASAASEEASETEYLEGALNMNGYEEKQQQELAFLMETYGLQKEELEGIDVARFVEDYRLREFDYSPEEIRELLAEQGDMYKADPADEIYWMLSQEGGTWREGAVPVRIGFALNVGTYPMRAVFDLGGGVVYYQDAVPHTLTAEQLRTLEELPDRGSVSSWTQWTAGEEAPSTGSYAWRLVLQDETGALSVYAGYTQDMSNLPEGYAFVSETLLGVLGTIGA